jgi:colicin import membrane protein
VTETETELQLKVWKELAISKQILMNAAASALNLSKDCTPDELKLALEATIQRSKDAELAASKAREQAGLDVAAVEQKLAKSQKALNTVEARLSEAQADQQKLEQQIVNDHANHERQVKKLKDSLAEKERALKAISTTLSDTPENVVKKLKTLRKQKMDESDARKKAEQALSSLRKEKQKLEQELKELQAKQEKPKEDKAA